MLLQLHRCVLRSHTVTIGGSPSFISECGLSDIRNDAPERPLVVSRPPDFVMLEQEPLWFPARHLFPMNPAVSDRQLWALGMIVVQWSMTEYFIDLDTRKLIGADQDTMTEYNKCRNFQQVLQFWKSQVEGKQKEPTRSQLLALVPQIQALNAQRDEVIHRMWGGGEPTLPPDPSIATSTDGGLMPNIEEMPGRTKPGGSGLIPFTWRATFPRLKRMAKEMASLNVNLLVITIGLPSPPHGDVNVGG